MEDKERQFNCPVCKQGTRRDNNPFRPFCSERCKLIDLGNWAVESYRIPAEKSGRSDAEEEEINITEK